MSRKEADDGSVEALVREPKLADALRTLQEYVDWEATRCGVQLRDGCAGTHFFRRHGHLFQFSMYKRLAKWGLVRTKLDATGWKVWLEEKGRAWIAVLDLREQARKERGISAFDVSVSGRTSCAVPNLQAIPRTK